MLSEEGGTVTVPVKTNDEITDVQTPDWITFTSSRALTGYTYTFTAEPNKTRKARKDYIFINGENSSERIEVSQDSYTPDSAWVDVPTCVIRDTSGSYPINTVPEYADASKVDVIENEFYLHSRITDNELHLNFLSLATNYLEEVSFQLGISGKVVSEYTIGILRPDMYLRSQRYMYYPGENFRIETIPEPYGKITYSDPDIIVKLEDGRLHAVKNGTCTITATNLASGAVASKIFTVYDVAIYSRLYRISNPHDDLWYVTFQGEARGRGITQYKMYIKLKGNNEQLAINQGVGPKATYSLDYNGTFSVHASSQDELMTILEDAIFYFEGTVGDRKVSVEAPANQIIN